MRERGARLRVRRWSLGLSEESWGGFLAQAMWVHCGTIVGGVVGQLAFHSDNVEEADAVGVACQLRVCIGVLVGGGGEGLNLA